MRKLIPSTPLTSIAVIWKINLDPSGLKLTFPVNKQLKVKLSGLVVGCLLEGLDSSFKFPMTLIFNSSGVIEQVGGP